MAASLEDILSRLLVPDNAVIVQATHELREAYKDPNIVQYLYNALCMSHNVQVRQYSAILLRKKICKTKAWKKLSEDTRNTLKGNLLERLASEKEKSVVLAVGQLVASIAKQECQSQQNWPQLEVFLNQFTRSKEIDQCRLGFYTVSLVSSVAPEMFKAHLRPLLSLFGDCLQSFADQEICFLAIKAMTSLVCCLGSDDAKCFQVLIPLVMEVVGRLAEVDEDKATEALELFDELIDSEIAVLLPHIKQLIKMCLDIAGNTKKGGPLRVRCMCLISWMINVKKKTIVKHKLIPELLNVLFPIMTEVSSEDLGEDEDDDSYSQTPAACAAQVVDTMALHLPPEKLIPPLSQHVETYLASGDPFKEKAAYLAIAVIAEGCSDAIRLKYLQGFLQTICRGVVNENVHIRNAALFALGQFADFLQPEVGKFAGEVVPILLSHLSQTAQHMSQTGKDPPNLSKTFYALETFCENLEEGLVPYLPALMEQLLVFLTSHSHRAKELAISCIGSAANASKEAMLPYFPRIMDHLKGYLTEQQSEQNAIIRTQAIDTLGCLARTMGAANFLPMAPECVQLGLRLIAAVDDPDLRSSTYGLFASLSSVLKADMAPYLDAMLEHMVTSLQSTEGVVTYPSSATGPVFPLFDELEESDNDDASIKSGDGSDDDDDDDQGHGVENAYLEEKEDVCVSLGEIAKNLGSAFVPCLERCFPPVLGASEHPAPDIQKAALACLGDFTVVLFHHASQVGDGDGITDVMRAVGLLVPKLIRVARTEQEREVVISALETLTLLLKELKGVAVEDSSQVEQMVSLVRDAFNHKLASQDEDSDEEGNEEREEAEYDGLLVQMAGDLVPALARALPAERFGPYLAGLLPFFMTKLKKQSSCHRSYAVGVLADVTEGLGAAGVGPFCRPLLQVFLSSMRDREAEVRSNAVFGLGVLVEAAGDLLTTEYPSILEALSAMLSKETSKLAKDNICGAVARLIMTSVASVPVSQVFPVLLQQLPLEEDFQENVTVFRCICFLYGLRHEEFLKNLPSVLSAVLKVIRTDQVSTDTRTSLVQLIKSMSAEIPNEVQAVLQSLSPQDQEIFSAVLTSA